MYASARQKRSVLVPIFEGGFLWHSCRGISLLLARLAFLLADHQSIFEVLHDDQELGEAQSSLPRVEALQQVLTLGRVPTEALQDCLQVLRVD